MQKISHFMCTNYVLAVIGVNLWCEVVMVMNPDDDQIDDVCVP